MHYMITFPIASRCFFRNAVAWLQVNFINLMSPKSHSIQQLLCIFQSIRDIFFQLHGRKSTLSSILLMILVGDLSKFRAVITQTILPLCQCGVTLINQGGFHFNDHEIEHNESTPEFR